MIEFRAVDLLKLVSISSLTQVVTERAAKRHCALLGVEQRTEYWVIGVIIECGNILRYVTCLKVC